MNRTPALTLHAGHELDEVFTKQVRRKGIKTPLSFNPASDVFREGESHKSDPIYAVPFDHVVEVQEQRFSLFCDSRFADARLSCYK